MKLKKGDKVRFLNDVGGGTVIKIIDEKMVEILNEDEFEIPVLAADLVRISTSEQEILVAEVEEEDDEFEEDEDFDFRYDRDEPEDEEEFENTIDYIEGNDELELFAALVPLDGENISESEIALYVINDSNFQAQAMAFELDDEDSTMIWNTHLESNTKVLVKTYSRSELGVFPKIRFQFLLYRYGKFPSQAPLQKEIEVAPLKFYKSTSFLENDFFDQDSMIIKLNEEDLATAYKNISNDDIRRVKKEQSQSDKYAETLEGKFNVRKTHSPIKEVDLHIHEIIENHEGMSNAEMLNEQMETFHSELAKGLKNHDIKKMVFIHGVGAGTLKNELRKSLQKDYPQLYFQDASFKEYGFGATMIILRRG
jgi:hypothetical protein